VRADKCVKTWAVGFNAESLKAAAETAREDLAATEKTALHEAAERKGAALDEAAAREKATLDTASATTIKQETLIKSEPEHRHKQPHANGFSNTESDPVELSDDENDAKQPTVKCGISSVSLKVRCGRYRCPSTHGAWQEAQVQWLYIRL
jgi:hypothetical protein